MSHNKTTVWQWLAAGKIDAGRFGQAMALASPPPDKQQWRQLFERISLYLGIVLVSAGIIFFMAFNWQALPHIIKLALVESILILFTLGYLWQQRKRRQPESGTKEDEFGWSVANALLTGISIMVGALLALVGQLYQTGADPWQLFALWALLITPLAWIAGFDLLWLLVVVLLNMAMLAYYFVFKGLIGFSFDLSNMQTLYFFALFNLLIHLIFSWFYRERLQPRFCAPIVENISLLATLVLLTVLMFFIIIDLFETSYTGLYIISYLVIGGGLFLLYRYRWRRLLPLTMLLLSGCITLCNVLFFILDKQRGIIFGDLLMNMLVIIGLTSGAVLWLKHIHREFHQLEQGGVDE